MRYETIVEVTPDGRQLLRLVLVPDEPVQEEPPESKTTVIIPKEEEDPFVIDPIVIDYEV